MKYTKQQIYTVVSAALVLIGAIFMLVSTFTDAQWAIWVGLAFAIVAGTIYILLVIDSRRSIQKKLIEPQQPKTEVTEQPK